MKNSVLENGTEINILFQITIIKPVEHITQIGFKIIFRIIKIECKFNQD